MHPTGFNKNIKFHIPLVYCTENQSVQTNNTKPEIMGKCPNHEGAFYTNL